MDMGQTMSIMVTQTVAMFLMMAIGIALHMAHYLDRKGAQQLASIAVYVATPAVVVNSLATDFSWDKLANAGICAVLCVVLTLGSAAIAWLVYRDRQRISQFAIMISNMGFIGIPLVQSVLGEEYVFYVSAAIAAQVPISWTYGIWLVSQDKSLMSPRKVLTNPSVIAVAVGIVLFFCSVNLSGVLEVTAMGNLNTGLAMLVLGSYLAETDFRSILRNKNVYLTNVLRLLVVPLLTHRPGLAPLPIAMEAKLVIAHCVCRAVRYHDGDVLADVWRRLPVWRGAGLHLHAALDADYARNAVLGAAGVLILCGRQGICRLYEKRAGRILLMRPAHA